MLAHESTSTNTQDHAQNDMRWGVSVGSKCPHWHVHEADTPFLETVFEHPAVHARDSHSRSAHDLHKTVQHGTSQQRLPEPVRQENYHGQMRYKRPSTSNAKLNGEKPSRSKCCRGLTAPKLSSLPSVTSTRMSQICSICSPNCPESAVEASNGNVDKVALVRPMELDDFALRRLRELSSQIWTPTWTPHAHGYDHKFDLGFWQRPLPAHEVASVSQDDHATAKIALLQNKCRQCCTRSSVEHKVWGLQVRANFCTPYMSASFAFQWNLSTRQKFNHCRRTAFITWFFQSLVSQPNTCRGPHFSFLRWIPLSRRTASTRAFLWASWAVDADSGLVRMEWHVRSVWPIAALIGLVYFCSPSIVGRPIACNHLVVWSMNSSTMSCYFEILECRATRKSLELLVPSGQAEP